MIDPAKGNAAMKRWIGVAAMAAGLALCGPAATGSAAAANSKVGLQAADLHAAGLHPTDASKATDLSARLRIRHYRHDAYHPYYRAYYYDRPYDYRPYRYEAPVPFFLGIGFGPRW
jgi:hypothetical protein